jgi:galactose mutarotase-like enzyme
VTAPGNDFNSPQRLVEALPHLHQPHGDLYFLPERSGLTNVARVEDPASGRGLDVRTDEPCLQFYTGVG